jgi:hypothetical protein
MKHRSAPRTLLLLTSEQCRCAHATLSELREFWIQRGEPGSRFFTLGATAYMDGASDVQAKTRYQRLAEKHNSLLSGKFGWLYESLIVTLCRALESEVVLKADAARPGFHIWQGESIPTAPTASVHFDTQYRNVQWPPQVDYDFSDPISFTVPIRLPAAGGGLYVWDWTYDESERHRQRGIDFGTDDILRFRAREFVEYAEGALVLHSGHQLHQIAPVPAVTPLDERITLQGHGIRGGGKWHLYW